MEDCIKDLEDLCRVCLKASYLEMKSLLDVQNANIVQDIEFCTGVKFIYEVYKPYQICSECLRRLKVAREFKTTCIKSEGIIKEAVVKIEMKADLYNNHVSLDTEGDVKCEASGFEDNECDNRTDCSKPDKDSDKHIKENENLKVRRRNRKCVQTKQAKPKKQKVLRIVTPKTSNAVKYKKLYCEKCDVKFDSAESFRAHKAKLHTDNQCICEVCGKTLMSRASMDTHMRFHRPPDYSCDRCGYSTGNKYDLAKHINIHLGTYAINNICL